MIDYKERRLRFWCQKVLPLVYDESLSYYELLCKIMKHLSEAETDVSALEQWLEELDAAAVKKVYSEWPLQASKEGNVVTLNNVLARDLITGVNAAEGSPITVTGSGHGTTDHLDPDDDTSPMGLTNYSDVRTIDIDDATTTKRGAMSVADKQKVDRLYNTFVEAGGNIIVSSTTASNGDTTYTVGVDPNLKVEVQKEYLVGDWEWNACLSGQTECGTWNTNVGQGAIAIQPPNLSTYNINSTAFRQGLQGIVVPKVVNSAYNSATSPCIGVCYAAAQDYPFATVTATNPVVDGETYFTTNNSIDLKVQLTGVGVGSRTFTVYLLSQVIGSGQSYSNTYLTSEDPYYPSYGVPYIPVKYDFTTDADGYASFTIPSGLSCVAHTTSTTASVAQAVRLMNIVAKGIPSDLYGEVRIDSCAISVKANLLQ